MNNKNDRQPPDKKDKLAEVLQQAHFIDELHRGPDDPAFKKNNLPDKLEKGEDPESADDAGE